MRCGSVRSIAGPSHKLAAAAALSAHRPDRPGYSCDHLPATTNCQRDCCLFALGCTVRAKRCFPFPPAPCVCSRIPVPAAKGGGFKLAIEYRIGRTRPLSERVQLLEGTELQVRQAVPTRGPALRCVHTKHSQKAGSFSVARLKMDLPFHNLLAYNRGQGRSASPLGPATSHPAAFSANHHSRTHKWCPPVARSWRCKLPFICAARRR